MALRNQQNVQHRGRESEIIFGICNKIKHEFHNLKYKRLARRAININAELFFRCIQFWKDFKNCPTLSEFNKEWK